MDVILENKKQAYDREYLQAHHLYNRLGYIKLICFAVLIFLLYQAFQTRFAGNVIILTIACFAISLFFWCWQYKIGKKRTYTLGMAQIYNNYLARINDQWRSFSDCGTDLMPQEHLFNEDLDITGDNSLFQYISVAATWHGRRTLADDLLYPQYSKKEIRLRQEAVNELHQKIEFQAEIQYLTTQIGAGEDVVELIEAIKEPVTSFKLKWVQNIILYWPALATLIFSASLLFNITFLKMPMFILLLLQAILWLLGLLKTQASLGNVSDNARALEYYQDIFSYIKKQTFTSKKLQEIQKTLNTDTVSAASALKDLKKIANRLSFRNNLIFYLFLNVFLLWDYECLILLDRWKDLYADTCESWFQALGELESLMSLSTPAIVLSPTTLPDFIDNPGILKAKNLGHPLIFSDKRVDNPVDLDNQIFIISGSNMSGKTTYLRAIGINLVLANAGGYVCAESFNTSFFELAASMRIRDDLSEGISTFYAELKKIKVIIEKARTTPHLLFLIDEIFRGTNSKDRYEGAKTVLFNLDNKGICGLITTHDWDLMDLDQQSSRIKNYHFSEAYHNQELSFSYQLLSGRSHCTNARHLMEMVGILAD